MKAFSRSTAKKVEFQLTAAPDGQAFLVGTFNQWDPAKHPMRTTPGSGLYRISLLLMPGRYEYKFVVNGDWRTDPKCPDEVPNEMGTMNSVITV